MGSPCRMTNLTARRSCDPRYSTLKKLQDAGVPFVITTGTNQRALDLIREAMFAVRFGVDPATALAAVTSLPARLLGVDDRVGQLAAGRDADFVVWSADPFDPAAQPVEIRVDGQPVPVSR